MLLITVPNRCHEDWNKMTPNEKGAFCKACSKTVVDFTAMTDDEVRNYFISTIGQKTCGHFRSDQLVNTDLAHILKEPIPLWKKFVAAVLVLFGSFLTGCKEKTTGKVFLPPETEAASTTTGVTLSGIREATEIEKPQMIETVCTATVGFTEPVILEITGEPEIEERPPAIKADTLGIKPDSANIIPPEKKKCTETDTTTIYYHP